MKPTSCTMLLIELVPQGISGIVGIRKARAFVKNFYKGKQINMSGISQVIESYARTPENQHCKSEL